MLRQLGQPEANEPIYMISGVGRDLFLHSTNDWASSSSSMQVIDNRVDTQIRLRQPPPLGALREVSSSSSPETRFWPAPSRSAKTCSVCLGK